MVPCCEVPFAPAGDQTTHVEVGRMLRHRCCAQLGSSGCTLVDAISPGKWYGLHTGGAGGMTLIVLHVALGSDAFVM